MTEKQPSNRHPTRRQVGQGSLRPPTGRPTNHPIGDYCTLVLGLAAAGGLAFDLLADSSVDLYKRFVSC